MITDLKTTAVRIKLRGAILISNIERAKCSITTLRKIIPSVNEVPDETIILQFKEFLARLEKVVRYKKNDDFDSKEIIKLFLRSDKKLYKRIKMIIHSICVSAVNISVESVIESLTSKFEIHSNKFRNVNEDTAYMVLH
jgi:acetolactate synthase small subunit